MGKYLKAEKLNRRLRQRARRNRAIQDVKTFFTQIANGAIRCLCSLRQKATQTAE